VIAFTDNSPQKVDTERTIGTSAREIAGIAF